MIYLASIFLFAASSILDSVASEALSFDHWEKVSETAFMSADPHGAISPSGTVVYISGHFQGQVSASHKGGEWITTNLWPKLTWAKCAYLNGKFILAGGLDSNTDSDPHATIFGLSTNGFDWSTKQTSEFLGVPVDVAFGNGRYLAATLYPAKALSSTDGENWIVAGNLPGNAGREGGPIIFAGHSFYVATLVGSEFAVYSSSDGTSWSRVSEPFENKGGPAGFCYGNGTFVVFARYPTPHPSYWSLDARTWFAGKDFEHAGDLSGFLRVIYSSGGFWGTTFDRRFAFSADGKEWRLFSPVGIPPGYFEGQRPPMIIAAGDGRAYAVGEGVFRSPEFTTLRPETGDPSSLSLYGRAGSQHRLEYLSGNSEWQTQQTVEIGPEGQTIITNWLSSGAPSRILRASSVP